MDDRYDKYFGSTGNDNEPENLPEEELFNSGGEIEAGLLSEEESVEPAGFPSEEEKPEQAGEDTFEPDELEFSSPRPYQQDHFPYQQMPPVNQQNGYSHNQPAQFGPNPPDSDELRKQKNRKTGLRVFSGLLALVIVLTIFGALAKNFNWFNSDGPSKGGTTDNTPTVNEDAPSLNIHDTPDTSLPAAQNGVLTSSQVAKKVKPSIVAIMVYSKKSGEVSSEGTGIIMGENEAKTHTYVVTCAHVISSANTTIIVQLEDGTQHEAEMVGYDSRTDVGVIKIKVTGLKAAEFGNSSKLEVGEQVFAVGNPGGVNFFASFTGGLVSAIDRPVNSEIGYTMECIQHDAAINPGNSGGALVNIYGQVIGINSLKIISSEYEGMGFAIPISSAKEIIDKLTKYGYVPDRTKLGISYVSASSDLQYSMLIQIKGLPAGSLIIAEISPDSDLKNTEAKVNDMIIGVNGKELDSANVLLEVIENGKVGETITLRICRVNDQYQTNEFDVKVKLAEDRGNQAEESKEEETLPFNFGID